MALQIALGIFLAWIAYLVGSFVLLVLLSCIGVSRGKV